MIKLMQGDCLELMKQIPDGSVDAVVTDPPYNIGFAYDTYNDAMTDDAYIDMISQFQNMPVALMHYPEEMMRLVLPALGPPNNVSAWCVNSNIARRLRLIGYWGLKPDYNKIRQPYKNINDKRIQQRLIDGHQGSALYEWWDDIQLVKNVSVEKTAHPCPVPVKLMKRIIELTTNPGDTILDPFMGSGTTGVACVQTNRNFIGIELDETYFKIAEKRIKDAQAQGQLF